MENLIINGVEYTPLKKDTMIKTLHGQEALDAAKKTFPDDVNKSIDELAEECCTIYVLTKMNADTPRMSGEHYLKYGFKAGYAACVEREVSCLKKENEIYEAALNWYANWNNSYGFLESIKYKANQALARVKTLREEKAE